MARRIWSIAIASIVSGAVAGCTATPAPVKTPAPPPNPTVGGVAMIETWTAVDNARAAPPPATFARAIDAAGLADTLGPAGPFTVFAPRSEERRVGNEGVRPCRVRLSPAN